MKKEVISIEVYNTGKIDIEVMQHATQAVKSAYWNPVKLWHCYYKLLVTLRTCTRKWKEYKECSELIKKIWKAFWFDLYDPKFYVKFYFPKLS